MRQILIEQLKCFDSRTEGKVLFLADLQEFFRRLSEIELDYSRNLERLSRMYLDKLQRHKTQRYSTIVHVIMANTIMYPVISPGSFKHLTDLICIYGTCREYFSHLLQAPYFSIFFSLFRKEKGTAMDLWQQVLIETKNKSKMHLGLSENVSNNVVYRIMIISEDCQRIAKKVIFHSNMQLS